MKLKKETIHLNYFMKRKNKKEANILLSRL